MIDTPSQHAVKYRAAQAWMQSLPRADFDKLVFLMTKSLADSQAISQDAFACENNRLRAIIKRYVARHGLMIEADREFTAKSQIGFLPNNKVE